LDLIFSFSPYEQQALKRGLHQPAD
jgi:hypothetical protein